MPPRSSDRLAEIRARVARRGDERPTEAGPAEAGPPPPDGDSALASASAHFLGSVEQIMQGRTVQRMPLDQVAPDLRPEMRQPRLIPPPDHLLVAGQPAPAYAALVAELLQLGHSLRERQIQPIIVYPGASERYPMARYLILIGHRRWTAATLVGLETLDAVVVEPPAAAERVRLQYVENEAREEFSDMERAWALVQMKQALGETTTWEVVEEQFRLSRTRRHELTRMLAFTPPQQQQIALLRLQETQIRSLHSAVRAEELSPAQVDQVLARLGEIAAERAAPNGGATESAGVRRAGIDGPTVARLVARARRSATAPPTPAPRWLAPLRDQVARASKAMQRAEERVSALNDAEAATLLAELEQLGAQVAAVSAALRQRDT